MKLGRSRSRVPDQPLLELARAEFHRAKQLRTGRIVAHAATLLVGVIGLLLSGRGAYVLALVAVITEAIAWTLRQQSRQRHHRAEQGLRTAELRRFYDPAIAGNDDAEFRAGVSGWACAHASEERFDDTEYWDAASGAGRESLRTAVRQSAFWSSRLYAEASKVAGRIAGGALAGALVLVFAFVLSDLDEAAEAVSRLTLLVITALISADALTMRVDWASAAADSRAAYQALSTPVASEADLLRLYVNYRAVTAATEPIPGLLDKRHKERLNAAWRAENTTTSWTS